ncbi:MAG: hypothetical protein PQJ50_07100 [Spirochaetales bacterium]|nr:hypothetical protein [Spirochaetales bacterium]
MRPADFFLQLNKRVFIFMAAGTLALMLIIVGVLVLRDYLQDRSISAAEERKMAYDSSRLDQTTRDRNRSNLLFPEVVEELDLSPDPYRDRDFSWTEEEVARLWIEPDTRDIDYFTDANHKLIWDILKDVP